MKKEDWLKEKLVESFEDFDAGLDLDQAWKELEARRNPKKKNRGIIFFLLGIGLLSMLVFTFMNKEEGATIISKTNAIVIDQESPIIENVKQDQESTIVENNKQEQERPIHKEFREKTIQNSVVASIEPTKKIRKTDIALDGAGINKNSFQTYSKTPVDVEQPRKADNIAGTQKQSLTKQKPAIAMAVQKQHNQLLAARTLSGLEMELQLVRPELSAPLISTLIEPVKNSASNQFGINLAYGLHQRSLTDLLDRSEYILARNAQETELDAIELNLFYRKSMPWSSFLEIGLGGMQTTYIFKDESTTETTTTLDNQIIEIHRFPDGTEETFLGSIMETETVVRNSKFYQNHRQLHANVLLGKQMPIKESLGVLFSTGLEYAFMMRSKGTAFSNLSELERYGTIQDLGYKKSGVLSGLLSAGIYKRIGTGNQLELSIAAKRNLNNIADENNFKETRNHVFTRLTFSKVLN